MSSDHQYDDLALKSPVITYKNGLDFLCHSRDSQHFSEMNQIHNYFG